MKPLRVMTYNIRTCRGMDNRYDPSRVADVIAEWDPDVVALQEVDRNRAASGQVDQAQEIAKRLQRRHFFSPRLEVGREQYGLAFLSRTDIFAKRSPVLRTPVNDHWKEKPIALGMAIKYGRTDVHFINTHFVHELKERQGLMTELLGEKGLLYQGVQSPLIVCGDFNTTTFSPVYRRMTAVLNEAPNRIPGASAWSRFWMNTWPSVLPLFRIDHIFLSDEWAVDGFWIPYNKKTRLASDHLPTIVDLKLKKTL